MKTSGIEKPSSSATLVNFCVASLILFALVALWFGAPQPVVHAQTTTAPVFTSAPTGNGGGIVIVDQSSGAVTYCASYVSTLITPSTPVPSDSCALMGRATPTTGSLTSLLVTGSGNTTFIVNNVSGQILQCATLPTIVGTTAKPVGTCISLGNANK